MKKCFYSGPEPPRLPDPDGLVGAADDTGSTTRAIPRTACGRGLVIPDCLDAGRTGHSPRTGRLPGSTDTVKLPNSPLPDRLSLFVPGPIPADPPQDSRTPGIFLQ